ncbi:hypothetical protein ACFL3V_06495 [Nanoarchaeota archaeon]
MTVEIVRDLGWLDRFGNISVTEYQYDDPTISEITMRYVNKVPGVLTVDDFYAHALYEPVLFFKGSPVGGSISAKQLLADFSDEPDWEMDQDLQLSWMQAFHGESQGYRQIYYPTGTFHVPMGFLAQGEAPDRVEHFYSMAKDAFKRGDTYWGFRFLSRALHYVQDVSQPFHTRQFYWKYISASDPFHGTIQVIKNYHFTYESYQANRFRLEKEEVIPKILVSSVRYSLPVETDSPSSLVKYIARRSFWKSSKTWDLSIDFFGEQYLAPKGLVMSKEEFFTDLKRKDVVADEFHRDLESRMVLFGKATKSFLEFARRDLNLDEYEP